LDFGPIRGEGGRFLSSVEFILDGHMSLRKQKMNPKSQLPVGTKLRFCHVAERLGLRVDRLLTDLEQFADAAVQRDGRPNAAAPMPLRNSRRELNDCRRSAASLVFFGYSPASRAASHTTSAPTPRPIAKPRATERSGSRLTRWAASSIKSSAA
jgi:hypothetical protein